MVSRLPSKLSELTAVVVASGAFYAVIFGIVGMIRISWNAWTTIITFLGG